MAAGAMTTERPVHSSRSKILNHFLFLLFVLVTAFVLHRFSWNVGTVWLFVGTLAYILLFIPADWRNLSLLLFVILVITTIVGSFVQSQLVRNESWQQYIRSSPLLSPLITNYSDTVVWSIIFGLVTALLVTLIPLLLLSYASGVYVLALHQVDGVSRWDALRYVLTLILGINLPYIVVQNGQALVTKDAGKLETIGGPGKLIIKEGNVVVLERGGKISRMVNAGVVSLKPWEKLRGIFILIPQTSAGTIEHVLTKDRIPLKIDLVMKYQIEPAGEVDKRPESLIAPDGVALTEKLDDGLFQVYEGTIRKAALLSQAPTFARRTIEKCEGSSCQNVEETTWQKGAGGLPEAELRDYIMSYRFDELFELVDSEEGEEPEVRVDKRKIYEIEQAILEQIKPSKISVLGVLVRAVDIGKIVFPSEARDLLLNHWGSPWRQDIGFIETQAKLESMLIEAQGEQEVKMLEAQSELDVTDLRNETLLKKVRSELQQRLLEVENESDLAKLKAKAVLTGARTEVEKELLATRGRMSVEELEAEATVKKAELQARAVIIDARAKAQARILEGQGEGEARAAFFREVLREIKREAALGNEELISAVLRQLINTMVSVKDLETFVRTTALMAQSYPQRSEPVLEKATSNGASQT